LNPLYPLVAQRVAHRCEYCHVPEAIFNLPFNETAPIYLLMAYAKAAQEKPSPAAVAILAKLAEAASAGIKARQKEKRQ
jgi:hypothetical protein